MNGEALKRVTVIDWLNLIANSFWILGCTLALAVLSYAVWQAAISPIRMRSLLAQPAYRICLDLAGMLFCVGLAATSRQVWEAGWWAVLALACATQTVILWRRNRRSG